ncbi:hypothetical protein [Nonomuraea cavernae]|uniref:hypothetical protein n=1 Tax=Nonomuraea cavernae TaxID=2045107 RepID=UPI0033D5DB46
MGFEDAAENRIGETVLLRWDGSRWRRAPRPRAAKNPDALLHSVSAEHPDDVWVTGRDHTGSDRAFVSHWDGRRWIDRRPFGVSGEQFLSDVTATDGRAWFAGSGSTGAIVVEWDGDEFHLLDSGLGDEGAVLNSISVKDGHLWAAGLVGDGENHPRKPLIYHRVLGRESTEQPETPEIPLGALNGISQVSSSDVWAVGTIHSHGDHGNRPLVMRWDGSKWSRVQVPITRGELYDVVASGTGDVWVGGIDADHAGQALFLHFDGTGWTREYSPPMRTGASVEDEEDNRINRLGITRVPGTTTLWAVGSAGPGVSDGLSEQHFVLRR